MSDLLDDDRYWTLGTLSQRYVKDVQAYIFRLEAARDLLKSRVAELEDDVAELGESRKDAVAEIEQLIEDRTATRERVEAAAVERDQLRARVAELEGWRPIETAAPVKLWQQAYTVGLQAVRPALHSRKP